MTNFLFRQAGITVLLIALSTAAHSQRWQTCESAEGGFGVLAPVPLAAHTRYQDTDIGLIAVHQHIGKAADTADNMVYMVTWYDLPEGSLHADSVHLLEDFFKQSAVQAAESVKGELVYDQPFAYQRYAGWQWRINYLQGTATIRTRTVLVGSRLYSLQVAGYTTKSLNPSVDKFMDSFKLLSSGVGLSE